MRRLALAAALVSMLVKGAEGRTAQNAPWRCVSLGVPRRVLRLRGGATCDFDETPCIGQLQDFGALERFYSTGDANEVFRRKLTDLKGQYRAGYRPVKGDGNCFIRGYVFGLLEGLLAQPPAEASGFRGAHLPARIRYWSTWAGLACETVACHLPALLVRFSSSDAGILMAYYFTMIDGNQGLGYSSAAVEDFYNDILNQVTLIEQVNYFCSPVEITLARSGVHIAA